MEALFINTEAKACQKVHTNVQRVLPLVATMCHGFIHGTLYLLHACCHITHAPETLRPKVSGSPSPASQKAVCCALCTGVLPHSMCRGPKWKWGFAERMTEGLEDPRHVAVTRSWLNTGLNSFNSLNSLAVPLWPLVSNKSCRVLGICPAPDTVQGSLCTVLPDPHCPPGRLGQACWLFP